MACKKISMLLFSIVGQQPSPLLSSLILETQFSVLNWLRNVIKCAFLGQLSTLFLKTVFSAILLNVAWGSGWDQLLCVVKKTTSKLSLTSSKIYVLPSLVRTGLAGLATYAEESLVRSACMFLPRHCEL